MSYDKEDVVAAIRSAVADRGAGFVYEKYKDRPHCSYSNGDSIGCLVGHVFNQWGASIDELRWLDQYYTGSGVSNAVRHLQWRRGAGPYNSYLAIEPDALSMLIVAQDAQDRGDTWGDVLHEMEAWDTDAGWGQDDDY